MDVHTIITVVVTITAIASSALNVTQWLRGSKRQAILKAVQAGAQGLLNLTTQVINDSNKTSLSADDVKSLASIASDIPSAISLAYKLTQVKDVAPVVPATAAPVA